MPRHSSEGHSAGLDFQSVFPEPDDAIASVPLCPDHSNIAQFTTCMSEESRSYIMQAAPYTPVKRLILRGAYVQIASDCGRRTPTLGQCSRVCEVRTADRVAFYR